MSADFVLEGVRHEYRAGAPALAAIDLTILSGQHVAVVGANGSGKSTLLKMLDGLVFPTSGAIRAFGAPLTEDALEDPAFRRDFRARVGFVFQEADVQLFCSDAYDELAFGPLQLGLPRDEVARRVREAAQQLRIEPLLDRPPYTLSGGEKKRVAIASVLTMQPHVLLLDEPFTGVDVNAKEAILVLLARLRERRITILVSTHDMQTAADRFELVALLNGRLVAYGPPSEVFTAEHIGTAFGGQALFLDGMVVIDQCCPGHVGDGEEHRHSHEPHAGPR